MALSARKMDELLHQIEFSVQTIRAHLAETEKTATGGSHETTADPLESASDTVKNERLQLFEATKSLQQLLSGPYHIWEQCSINLQFLSCFRWMLHFDIATILPQDELQSYDQVAHTANVPVLHLRHVIRMLMTAGIFTEPKPDMMAHNAVSSSFRKGSPHAEACAFMANLSAPTSFRMAEMTQLYKGSDKPTETAMNVAMQTELPFFAYLSKSPDLAAGLMAAMRLQSEKERLHTKHLIEGFDWGALGSGKVIDVGGSMGHVSIGLAQKFPYLTFEVQDLPVVVAKARKIPLGSEVADRIKFTVHDFFQPQPASSSDAMVFLVRAVLQNHPVAIAQSILRNIAMIMNPGALIIINNAILPEPGTVGSREEASERARGLFMIQAMNGADRDQAEFEGLIAGVGQGVRLREVIKPKRGTMAIFVVEKMDR